SRTRMGSLRSFRDLRMTRWLSGIELACNYNLLNLGRALVNLRDLGVAEQSLDRIVLDVPVAAEDLDRLRRGEHRGLARQELGHRAELRDVLAAILGRRREVHQRARRRHAG